MDLEKIATATIALLAPYLAKTGEVFAKEVGEQLAEKVKDLHEKLKDRFKKDSYAQQTLARVEKQPNSEGRKDALRTVLVEKMEEDEDFAETLHHLVEESKQFGGGDIIEQQLSISGQARVKGGVFQVGKMEGDINNK